MAFTLMTRVGWVNEKSDYDRAEREILAPDAQTYIDPCRDLIKLEIENPDSFDDSLFGIKASHTKEGVDNVTMNFTSNDSNGLPIPQSALCTFGPSDEKEVVISAGESNAQRKNP